MNKILEYIRLIFIVGGVLIGIQGPGFVDQYGKALQAHYFESQICIKEFQEDADKFFDGSLPELIEHYQQTSDPVFIEGGASIEALVERNILLAKAYQAFYKDVYGSYVQVLFYPVPDIRQEVIESYTYAIVLNQSAVLVGLISGLLVAIVMELIIWLISRSVRALLDLVEPVSRKTEKSKE